MLESHTCTSCSILYICVVHCMVTIFACVVHVRVKALNYVNTLFSNFTNICAI